MSKGYTEKTGHVEVEGGRIGYLLCSPENSEARKRTPLVVIHGGPGGNYLELYHILHTLAECRPVLFYDQLGSHHSPCEMTPELMSIERFFEEPILLMNELAIDRASFLGHSWGAVIALNVTLNSPEKVESLILSSPLISTSRWVKDCNSLLKKLPEEIQQIISRCEKEGTTNSEEYKRADGEFSRRYFLRNQDLLQERESCLGNFNPTVYNHMWGPSEFSHTGTMGDLDLFPDLKNIKASTLIITGEYDMATPDYMEEVREQIENAKLEVITNSGHCVHFDGKAGYLEAVNEFLG